MEDTDKLIKVCHISTVHRALDTRIYYKECRTLAEKYEVYLIANHDKEETVQGVHILPLPKEEGRVYRFLKKRKIALKMALEVDADIYHFHDPELIPVGKKLKVRGKKVIYDVHEDVPKQILSKDWLRYDFLRKIISRTFNTYEKSAIMGFDKVIAARPDIAANFPESKVQTVINLPVLTSIDHINKMDVKAEKPVIIYAGGMTQIRGIKELVEAVGLLKGKAELWLFGPWDDSRFKAECMNLEGWEYVRDFGFVKQDDVYAYMKVAAIGVVPFWPVPNHVHTLPNKPFEYMACKLPMVMSNFEYWKEIFKGCFLPADPRNPQEFAEKLSYLLDHEKEARSIGEYGRKLVEDKYSWEAEKQNLFKVYKGLEA